MANRAWLDSVERPDALGQAQCPLDSSRSHTMSSIDQIEVEGVRLASTSTVKPDLSGSAYLVGMRCLAARWALAMDASGVAFGLVSKAAFGVIASAETIDTR